MARSPRFGCVNFTFERHISIVSPTERMFPHRKAAVLPAANRHNTSSSSNTNVSNGWSKLLPGRGRLDVAALFVRLSLVGLLVSCCVMTSFQLRKYLSGQTTVAHRVEDWHRELPLPAVSFCPGFREEKVRELVWPSRFLHEELFNTSDTFDDTFPAGRAEADALWDELTFKPEEVIVKIGARFQGVEYQSTIKDFYSAQELLDKKVGCLMLEQHDTLSGKCYTVTTWCDVKAAEYLMIELSFDNITSDAITASLHHPKAYLGNNANFYPGPVSVESVAEGASTDLVVSTLVKRKNRGASGTTEDDFYDCVNEAVHDKARDIADSLCYHPSFKSTMGKELAAGARDCDDEKDFFNSNLNLMSAVALLFHNECRKPNVETSYKISKRRNNVSSAYLSFGIMQKPYSQRLRWSS